MKRIVTLTLILLPLLCFAQSNWHDSLLRIVNTDMLTTAEKIGAYHLIAEGYSGHDMENTYKYGMKGLELARKAGDKRMMAFFYRYIGSTYVYRTVYDTAHIYQRMNIDLAHELQDINLLQIAYFGLANIYARQAKFGMALENYQRAMGYYDEEKAHTPPFGDILDDLSRTWRWYSPSRVYLLCLGNSGECYRRLNNPEKALFYLTQSKQLLESGNELYSDGSALTQTYRELGYVFFALGNLDEALEYFEKVLSLPGGLGYVQRSDCKEGLIKIHIARKEFEKALAHAQDCLELAAGLGDPYIYILAWNSFANIYRAQGRYKECGSAAMKAWALDSTSVDTAPVSAFNIAYAGLHSGDTEKADYYFKKYEEFNIQKSNRNFQEALADMEVRYETEKTRMRIASLEKEKRLYVLIGIAALLSAASMGISLWQKIRNGRREKQLIATRFVLDGEMRERARIARDLHDRLSGSLSALKIGIRQSGEPFRDVNVKLDACIEEVRRVSHNLMPASLQFGLKTALEDFTAQLPGVRFHFFGDQTTIGEREAFVVYCCASELVNNALRHSGARNVDVQLVCDQKHIVLTVQDDGCGFDHLSAGKGIGLKNIRDRIISCDGKIDIATSPDKGTEITIELKI